MIDVLFIDDDLSYAESWAERITEAMRLYARATSVPSEALSLARDPGIRVVVIDEKLDGTGTDGVALGVAIKQIDPRIRWILLSGEATGAEITKAYDTGLQRHIHKNDALDQLSSAIRQYLIQHGTSLTTSIDASASPLFTSKAGRFRRQDIKYYLISVDSVEKDYVAENEWVSHTQINSGEDLEEELDITWSRSDTLESTSETKAGAEAQLGVPKLNASLRSEVTSRESLTSIISTNKAFKLKRKIRLPAEPSDPNILHIRSRMFQVAPVYVRVGVTVVRRCSCCGHDEPIKGYLYFPRRRYATRQEDFLSDGTSKVTRTGMKDLSGSEATS